jgi:hypothetical protein
LGEEEEDDDDENGGAGSRVEDGEAGTEAAAA